MAVNGKHATHNPVFLVLLSLSLSPSFSITPVKLRQETTKSTECDRWTSNLQIRLRKSATAPERGAQSLFVTTTLG